MEGEGMESDTGGGTPDDIEGLLSAPVSKDYINCVWTHERGVKGKRRPANIESSPRKLVINDLSESSDQEKVKVDDKNGNSSQQPSTGGKKSKKLLVNMKKKEKKSKSVSKKTKTSSSLSDKILIDSAETMGDSVNSDEHASGIIESKKKKRTLQEEKGSNPPMKSNKKPLKKAEEKMGDEKVLASVVHSNPSSKSQDLNSNALEPEDLSKLEDCRPLRTLKTVRSFLQMKPSELNKLEVKVMNGAYNSLAAACKNLVLNRSLPPYTPKHVDSRFFSGHYFSCKGCDDKFVLQTSLIAHMARKVGRFCYKCPVCDVRMCFDNRCVFLVHIQFHEMNVNMIKQEDILVLPLLNEESVCDTLFKHVSSNNFKCPECSKIVGSMEMHLQGLDGLPVNLQPTAKPILYCSKCSFVLPTQCAFAAHERFHEGEPPYLCPECGVEFLTLSSLSSHMEETCLHDHKRTIFHCASCKVVLVSIELYTEHLTAKHLRSVYKCHACGVSVGGFKEFNAHRVDSHKMFEVEPLSGTAALCARAECDKCPGVVISLDSLQDHAVSHTSDPQIMASVYQCKMCKCMYSSKDLLVDHKGSCPGKTNSNCGTESEHNLFELCGDAFSSFQHPTHSEINLSQQAPQGSLSTSFSGSVSSGPPVDNHPQDCGSNNGSIEEQKISGNEIPKNISANQSGGRKESKISISDSSEDLNKNIVCKLCKEVVSVGVDKAAIKKHFTSHHFTILMKAIHDKGSAQLPTQIVYTKAKANSKKNLEGILKTPSIGLNGVSDNNCKAKVLKKKVKAPRFAYKSSRRLVGGNLKEARSSFSCYKCLFTSKDEQVFKSHINSHKSNPSDLQCPQCGLCFIVRPPLEKHLIVEHGIKNVDKYLLDHGFEDHSSEDDEMKQEVENEELQENQCKVCREIFESAILLEKHFRVHGGAFLLANMKAKKLNL